jgi:Transposase, Mutator family
VEVGVVGVERPPGEPAEERERAMVDRLLAATIDPQCGWATEVEICRPVVDRSSAGCSTPTDPGSFRRGMSTRKVDDLVRMLAADSGSSTSEVSGICADLNAEAGTIRDPQRY